MAAPLAENQKETSTTSGITFMQYAILVAVGAFATTFAQQRVLGNYPTLFLLKNHFHLKKEDISQFFFWATFAWNIKPLAGILTDAFPLFGTRRKSYMILGASGAAILWIVMGFFPNNYNMLLIASIGVNVATVIASTVMGGLMVEAGQMFGASGRMSSLRQVVQSIAGVGAPLLGGYLAGKAFGWTATTTLCAITSLMLVAVTVFVLKEKPLPPRTKELVPVVRYTIPIGAWIGLAVGAGAGFFLYMLSKETQSIGKSLFALVAVFILIIGLVLVPTQNAVIAKAQAQLSQILRSRTLWLAATMLFLVYTVPGFSTAMTFRQTDDLKFSPAFIGQLDSIASVCGLIGAFIYAVICRKINLRALIVGAVAINAATTLLYLIYNRGNAIGIQSIGGFIGVMTELALMDLAVRSTPKGCEALGFSLMMSVRNFGIGMSDVLGSKMIDSYHIPFNTLVIVNAATTAVVLLFVFFLPKIVMNQKEGEAKAAEEPQ